jgi:hypothetical protein
MLACNRLQLASRPVTACNSGFCNCLQLVLRGLRFRVTGSVVCVCGWWICKSLKTIIPRFELQAATGSKNRQLQAATGDRIFGGFSAPRLLHVIGVPVATATRTPNTSLPWCMAEEPKTLAIAGKKTGVTQRVARYPGRDRLVLRTYETFKKPANLVKQ